MSGVPYSFGGSRASDFPVPKGGEEIARLKESAPLVIVGLINGDQAVGKVEPSQWDEGLLVQLHELVVLVENVLKGDLSGSVVLVRYYSIESRYNGSPRLGSWLRVPGGGPRQIFYMTREGNQFRLACDLKNYCTEHVGSGSHLGYVVDKAKTLTDTVADILLSRGTGVTDQEYLDSMYPSVESLPENLALSRLKAMASNPAEPARSEACWILSYRFSKSSDVRDGGLAGLGCKNTQR